MTVQELYEWAKERNLLDKQIAKYYNFNIKDIETVIFLSREYTNDKDKIVLD